MLSVISRAALYYIFLILLVSAVSEPISHAHEDEPEKTVSLHFSHPLIAESPSPDKKVRLDYFFLDVDGEVQDEELGEEGEGPSKFTENTINLELEYAFSRNISIEADIPFTFLNPDQGDNVSHFNNIEVGLKLASFILAEYGILVGGGIEFGLPTGDDSKGIGSDNIFEIEPFLSFGYKHRRLEIISFLSLGFPVNQNKNQDEGDELGYNLAMLLHATDFMHLNTGI